MFVCLTHLIGNVFNVCLGTMPVARAGDSVILELSVITKEELAYDIV